MMMKTGAILLVVGCASLAAEAQSKREQDKRPSKIRVSPTVPRHAVPKGVIFANPLQSVRISFHLTAARAESLATGKPIKSTEHAKVAAKLWERTVVKYAGLQARGKEAVQKKVSAPEGMSTLFEAWRAGGAIEPVRQVLVRNCLLTLWIKTANADTNAPRALRVNEAKPNRFYDSVAKAFENAIVHAQDELPGMRGGYSLVLVDGLGTFAAPIGAYGIAVDRAMWSAAGQDERDFQMARVIYECLHRVADPYDSQEYREVFASLWGAASLIARGQRVAAVEARLKKYTSGPELHPESAEAREAVALAAALGVMRQGGLLRLERFCARLLLDRRRDAASFEAVARLEGFVLAPVGTPVKQLREFYTLQAR